MKKLLLAILMVVFAIPAFAYEIALPGENNKLNLYGSIRMHAWYLNGNVDGKVQGGGADGNDFMYAIQGNSRLGVDLAVGNFFAKVETNFAGDGGTGFGFRLFYGGYKFEHGGVLTIGRQFTLAETMLAYDSLFDTDAGLSGYGTLAVTRTAMIKYGIKGFEIAVVDMNPFYSNYEFSFEGTPSTKVADKIIPMIEAAYNMNFKEGMITGKVFASYAGVDVMINNGIPFVGGQRELINTGSVGAVLKIKVDKLTIVPSAFYSLNGGLVNKAKTAAFGGSTFVKPTTPRASVDGANVRWDGMEDVSTFGVALSLGYKLSDMVSLVLGGGYESSTGSQFRTKPNAEGKTSVATVDSYSIYLNAPLSVTKNILIIPTVAYFAGFSDATGYKSDIGNLIAGAQFRVNF